jgi:hypothetical protein
MENHGQGTHSAKMSTHSSVKKNQLPEILFGRSAQLAQKFEILLKKGFIRRP